MARIMIDKVVPKDSIMEYAYTNKNGNVEYVSVEAGETAITINSSEGEICYIYKTDIPKLIKALQTAQHDLELQRGDIE